MAKVAKAKKSVPEKSVKASLWESASKLRSSVEPAKAFARCRK
jgi:type I restriction enzyme M protein